MCKADCACQKRGSVFNLKDHEYRTEMLDGKQHLVVPVIMARNDVVMNGAYLPDDEMFPDAWNGVPVTVGHPTGDGDSFLSANSPQTIEEWCVGRIFNSKVEDGALKGEAWIQVDKAKKLDPTLLSQVKKKIDVSTGYFADAEPAEGTLNGRSYEAIHRNVRPDHLALLPGEVGACSWGDGCGVRTNRSKLMKEARAAFTNLAKALGFKMADPKAEEDPPKDDEEVDPKTVENELSEEDDPKKKEPAMNAEQIQKMITDAVGTAVANALAAHKPALSKEDQAAVSFANNMVANHKKSLVDKIVANTDMKKEVLEAMDVSVLETIANGIRVAPEADFSGRFIGTEVIGNAKDDPEIAGMSNGGVVTHFRNRNKKDAA